jgi:hypothetical protein
MIGRRIANPFNANNPSSIAQHASSPLYRQFVKTDLGQQTGVCNLRWAIAGSDLERCWLDHQTSLETVIA